MPQTKTSLTSLKNLGNMMFKGVFYMKSKRVIAAMLSAVMLAGQCISVFAEDENITKLTFGYPTGWESTEQAGSYTFYQPNCKGAIYIYTTDEPNFDIMSGSREDINDYMLYSNPRTSLSAQAAQLNVSEVEFDSLETYTEMRNNTLYREVEMNTHTFGGTKITVLSYMCIAGGNLYHFDLITDSAESGKQALLNILDTSVYAGDNVPESDLEAEKYTISINVDGRRIRPDSEPVLISGRTLVPIRAVAENLGYDVNWDAESRTVTMTAEGKSEISVTIDADSIEKGGSRVEVDVPAQIIDSRTYLPLRAVAEAMDCRVEWNGETKTVDIFS